jgi:WS/DGAT/MGAT family acyltransferase
LAESSESPKHVAALIVFDPPTDYQGNFVADLFHEMLRLPPGPPFDQKIKPGLLTLPRWITDTHMDLEYHLRHAALPQPGTLEELMTLVSRLHARLLDRDRPLWECYLIEGLEGGRFAIYAKLHHAFMDGATGVMLMQSMLGKSPEEKMPRAFWEASRKHPGKPRRVPDPLEQILDAATVLRDQAKAIPELSRALLKMAMQSLGLRQSRIPVPFMAPRSPLNAPITAARRVATATLSLQRIKRVGKSLDATVNDVVLAVVDSALNRYLRQKKALPDKPLVAQMPVSLRREGDTRGGNQITILLVSLGSRDAGPVQRLQEIKASSAQVKQDTRALSSAAITDYMILTQGAALALDVLGLSQQLPPLANVLVSNVPGPSAPLYLNGATVVALYPLSTLPPGLSLNVTVFTYNGAMNFGLVADRYAIPELAHLADLLTESFENLEAAAGKPASKPRLARKTSSGATTRARKGSGH